ncbi:MULTISPECIES: Tox-REase-5 domain-containing protein [unclassified Paraburkholderia]|uniref:Tox-REase-5 domain-containing protein n=1 Tax=unclassified Paraburkholderia TaxID=2615204 RepID=UPI002AB118B6|nr:MULTISPECIES: Tox-REase-5 domain-containing protein [unclassified Paraburkholderia]
MVGIFPPGLATAGNALAQTMPEGMTVPPPLIAGPTGGADADADINAGSGAPARDRSRDRQCKCLAAKGNMAPVPYVMSDLSAQYQHFVTGFPPKMEWKFSNKDFDGFVEPRCRLQEPKAKYELFFDKNGKPKFFFFYGKGPNNSGKNPSSLMTE